MEVWRILARIAAAADRAEALTAADALPLPEPLRIFIEMSVIVDRLAVGRADVDRITARFGLEQALDLAGCGSDDAGACRRLPR